MIDISNLKILYEDNHLIAVNKPVGWLVQGDKTGDLPLIDAVKEFVRIRYKKPGEAYLGLIHRLDRPVSGVVVFARTSKALTRMNKLFQERKINKTYWAITTERPDPINGKLEHWLWKDHDKNISKIVAGPSNRFKDPKQSELSYTLLAGIEGQYLLEVKPKTGRPHQIRVQLASIGCPIKADIKYGSKAKHPEAGIYLHCRSIEFEHPVKKEMVKITAEVPRDQDWKKMAKVVQ